MSIITIGDLARRVRKEKQALPNKFCVYGPPGAGKTLLAATICKLPDVGKILWCDLEDGLPTVITAKNADGSFFFSEEELARMTYVPIPDRTMLDPGTSALLGMDSAASKLASKGSNAKAARILLPLLTSPKPSYYDVEQQLLVNAANENTLCWHLAGLGTKDVLVLDSGTQLGASIFSLAIESNPDHDHGMRHWMEFTTNATAMLSAIQAARCMVIMICHSMEVEPDLKTKRKAKTLPWFGSVNFSQKVGHYFGTVVHMYTDTAYRSLSCPITKLSVQGKSRFNIDTSRLVNPTMEDLLGISARAHTATTTVDSGASASANKANSDKPVSATSAGTPATTPAIKRSITLGGVRTK
jgi:ABC-type multidrug transport system, ATPase component